MKEKIRGFFLSLLTQDMAKQASQVEFLTLIIFIILLLVTGWFWQYQIELTSLQEGKRVVVGRMNIFELLLSKK